MTIFRFSWVVVAFLVAGCNRQDDELCSTVMFQLQPKSIKEDADRCVAQWSWQLARGKSSDRDTAAAAVGACRDRIDAGIREVSKNKQSEVLIRSLNAEFREYALFMVVRARAGNCESSLETVTGHAKQ